MNSIKYSELLQNKDYSGIIRSFTQEYISIGYSMGYINESNIRKIKNLKVKITTNINGSAVTDGNTITFNLNNFYSGSMKEAERKSFSIFAHECSHVLNSFHDDQLLRDNSIFRIFVDNYVRLSRNKFGQNVYVNPADRMDNIDNFAKNAVIFLDEVVAQEICEDIVAKKYNINRNNNYHCYNNFGIAYRTNFEYYGILQEAADKFAKTLAGVNSLNDLAKLSTRENAPLKVMSEHIENAYAFNTLYNEFCRMGAIIYLVYYMDGHAHSSRPTDEFVRNAYYELLQLSERGYENRNVIRTPRLILDRNNRTINW